ncbi:MAG: hypothetical protein D6741_09980, partial [Planctomycetota bacterium]
RETIGRYRRGVPDGGTPGTRRCGGCTIWRLNDPWPMMYMSLIDYYLQPKHAYYYLARTYRPVLLTCEQTPDYVAFWIVNDSPQPIEGTLVVRHLTFDGKERGRLTAEVRVPSGASRRVLRTDELGEIRRRQEFYAATFGDQTLCRYLAPERYLQLKPARLEAELENGTVVLQTDVPCRQVSLEVPGVVGEVFSDNYFDLLPGEPKRIAIRRLPGGDRIVVSAVNAAPVELPLEGR